MHALSLCLPQDMTPTQFLRDYWGKKPLLIKNGLPSLAGMLCPSDVLELSQMIGVQARLVCQHEDDAHWSLETAPFALDALPARFSILVQNMEGWMPDLGRLWGAFDFIPKWQQDDIMVSYAPDGGSVGAHFDEYDVFLAQVHGKRRWRLGKHCTLDEPMQNAPIRLLEDMGQCIFDEMLDVGDVLYVPTKMAHFGIAQGDAVTASFGFRRPSPVQILDAFADASTAQKTLFSPLDVAQNLQSDPYELTQKSIQTIQSTLLETLTQDAGTDALADALSCILSARSYDQDAYEPYAVEDFVGEAMLTLNPAVRLIYRTKDNNRIWYFKGERWEVTDAQSKLLTALTQGTLKACDVPTKTLADWCEDQLIVPLD